MATETHSYKIKDANLIKTDALPNGAATTDGTSIQVTDGSKPFLADAELLIEAPLLGTTPLPDTETMTYDVQDSADDSTFADIASGVLVQTGAGGAGDAAAEFRYRLPTNVRKFIRVQATNSGAGDASGSDMTTSILT